MAAKQAEALSAHSALRRRIVENLKRTHPDAFSTAERSMGMRMSDVEDDVLVTYMDALTERHTDTSDDVGTTDGIDAVRQVMLRAGIPIPEGGDLISWVAIIERHLSRLTEPAPAARTGTPAAAAPAPAPASDRPSGLAGRATGWGPPDNAGSDDDGLEDVFITAPLGSEPAAETPEDDAELDALLAELDGTAEGAPGSGFTEVGNFGDEGSFGDGDAGYEAEDLGGLIFSPVEPDPVEGDLDDLFDTPTPEAPAVAPDEDDLDDLFGEPAAAAPTEGDLDDLFGEPAAPAANPADGNLDDLFDPPPAAPDNGPADDGLNDLFDPPAAPPAPAGTSDGLDDLFDAPAAPAAPAANSDGLDDLFGEPAAPATPAGGDLDDLFDTPAAAPAATPTAANDGLDDLFAAPEPQKADGPDVLGELFASSAQPEPAPAQPAAPAAPTAVTPTGMSTADLFSDPLRPTLVPTQKRRRKPSRKTPRTRAVAADRDTPDSGAEAGPDVELDTGSRNAILAAVAIPRPVFISDLEAVAGGRAAVESWEGEMRSLKTKAPVRLIGGKPRHRALGALVIPHGDLRDASTEFTQSWWADCMDAYTGGKLFELGVLLRRVGNQVVSATFSSEVAVLRLNTPRGLVGIVVTCGVSLEDGGDTRTEMVDELAKLVGERLSLIAVLSTTADQADEDRIADAVPAAAEAQQWPPTTPIVFSHSWEWGDTAGSVMKLLHGG